MNCDAKQGCFFKKSVCNSGCKSKLPVEIAKVSTARLTFSSPLARLSEAFPPFLFFFLFLLRLQLFFLIKPLGVIFRLKKIVPRSSNLSMIYHISWIHLFSFHRTVRGYNPTMKFWPSTDLSTNQHGWLLHCAAITIGWNIWRWLIFRHTVVRSYDRKLNGLKVFNTHFKVYVQKKNKEVWSIFFEILLPLWYWIKTRIFIDIRNS